MIFFFSLLLSRIKLQCPTAAVIRTFLSDFGMFLFLDRNHFMLSKDSSGLYTVYFLYEKMRYANGLLLPSLPPLDIQYSPGF